MKRKKTHEQELEEIREYLKLHPPITAEQMHEELMQNPEYKKIWEESRPAFAVRSALVEARIKGEITQEEIAKRAGTTQSAIARFESGRNQPTLAFMQRLAAALGKRVEITFVDV